MRKFFVYRLEVSEKKRNFASWYVGGVAVARTRAYFTIYI